MARYNQPNQNDTSVAPLDQGLNRRGGHYNRGRGKGRGGYNGGNRERSQQSGNYGPRYVRHANATSVKPFPPAPCGLRYGRYSQAPPSYMPNAAGPLVQPVNTQVDPAMLQSPHIPGGHFVSPHLATHTSTPAHTPIVTPTSIVATPNIENMSPSPSTNDNVKIGPATQAGVMPGANETDVSKTSDSPPAATTNADTQEPSRAASHIQALVPKRLHNTAPITRESIVREFIPHEGQTAVMDVVHNTPAATVRILGHDTLMRLQIFNITLARKLQDKLEGAKKSHDEQEHDFRKKRGIIMSLLLIARDAERSYELNIQRLQDRFCYKMEEACELDGEAKKTAQLNAIAHLNSATETSRLAAEQREKIEKYRNNLNDVDNARAVSQNKYSDAVHEVLMIALGAGAVEKHMGKEGLAAPSGVANAATVSTNKARAQEDRKDSGATTLPQTAGLKPQQSAFERQPQSEPQSIGKVLQRNKTSYEHGHVEMTVESDNDKSAKVITPKSQFAQSPATVANAIAHTLDIKAEDWTPESLRHLVTNRDDTTAAASEEAKEDNTTDKALAKQEALSVDAKNMVHPQPAVAKLEGKGKGKNKSAVPAGSTSQSSSSDNQGTGRRKYYPKGHNKKSAKGGADGDSMTRATPKAGSAAGPPSGDMRKGS